MVAADVVSIKAHLQSDQHLVSGGFEGTGLLVNEHFLSADLAGLILCNGQKEKRDDGLAPSDHNSKHANDSMGKLHLASPSPCACAPSHSVSISVGVDDDGLALLTSMPSQQKSVHYLTVTISFAMLHTFVS